MTSEQSPQPVSLIDAIIPVASLILLVAVSYMLFGDAGAGGPNQVALACAAMMAVLVARRRGHSLEELSQAAAVSVGSGIGAIFILLAVGALIGTWALSGTLVAMVYYGLQVLDPNLFYVTTTALCAVISFGIGSSWTVVGTIGIGLMGIGAAMDMNPAITAAAIISGAYFGDTTSPLSDSCNLAVGASGADLYTHIRETVMTSGAALALSLVVFWWLGQPGAFDISAKSAVIASHFHMSPLLFLPLVLVVALAILKLPPFSTIFIGALAGGLVAVLFAPERVLAFADAGEKVPTVLALIKGVWLALGSGYVSSTGVPQLDALATRGGMSSMLTTIWLIITAFAFGGVVEKAGILARLIEPIIRVARSAGSLVAALVGSILATNIATADQYLAIVLPGRMFKGEFARRQLAPVVLSRSIGGSATPTSALIPWNSCGAYMAATLGVSAFSYFPYAVFNFASPILVVLAALAGLRMFRTAQAKPA